VSITFTVAAGVYKTAVNALTQSSETTATFLLLKKSNAIKKNNYWH